jgi:peroxiredoxin
MVPERPTNELAAAQLSRYVRTPEPGEFAFPVSLMDEEGRQFGINDDHISGVHVILVFVMDFEDPGAIAELTAYVEKAALLKALRCRIVLVSGTSDASRNRAHREKLGAPFPVLGDANGGVFAAFGLETAGANRSPVALRSVMVTPLRQIRCIWDRGAMTNHAEAAETILTQARLADELSWSAPHPPVLMVPQVLSPEDCELLIKQFESSGDLIINRQQAAAANKEYKLPIYEHGRQDRVDHVIVDKQVLSLLDKRLNERVIPAIKHAFAFDVTRREGLHIARYVGARGGNQMGHRDNKLAMFYRRFALSLNLNDDYKGGEIVFREYSNRGYRCPPGTAMVFSSALLHEVQETTEGVRYTLISHFFNDATAQDRGPSGLNPGY